MASSNGHNERENAHVNAPEKNQVTPERLLQFGSAYGPPIIIGAAVNNRIFDVLATGQKTLEEMSKETSASVRGLRAIVNALVGLELLKKSGDKYSLAPESAAFLVSEKPGSLAGFFSMNTRRLIPLWLKLDDSVRTGRPAKAHNEEETGTEFFSELVENIMPMSYGSAQALADHLNLAAEAKQPTRVLDLAAGSGVWGIVLAQKSPVVQVTAVDWSGMIPTTRRITQKFGVADRFKFVEGDLLEADFGKDYDIATLGLILHSEGEERSRKLLKKTFGALRSGGTIVIAELLVNDERTEPLPSLVFAVNMLLGTEKGDTFSFNEIKSWLEEADFKNARTLTVPAPSPLVLATKP